MLSARFGYKPSARFQLQALGTWFHTTDYASAVYLYEPDVMQSGLSTALAYHGARTLFLLRYQLVKWADMAIRVSSTRYFNRSVQSSGVMQIDSPWKNDVSFMLRIKL